MHKETEREQNVKRKYVRFGADVGPGNATVCVPKSKRDQNKFCFRFANQVWAKSGNLLFLNPPTLLSGTHFFLPTLNK